MYFLRESLQQVLPNFQDRKEPASSDLSLYFPDAEWEDKPVLLITSGLEFSDIITEDEVRAFLEDRYAKVIEQVVNITLWRDDCFDYGASTEKFEESLEREGQKLKGALTELDKKLLRPPVCSLAFAFCSQKSLKGH